MNHYIHWCHANFLFYTMRPTRRQIQSWNHFAPQIKCCAPPHPQFKMSGDATDHKLTFFKSELGISTVWPISKFTSFITLMELTLTNIFLRHEQFLKNCVWLLQPSIETYIVSHPLRPISTIYVSMCVFSVMESMCGVKFWKWRIYTDLHSAYIAFVLHKSHTRSVHIA